MEEKLSDESLILICKSMRTVEGLLGLYPEIDLIADVKILVSRFRTALCTLIYSERKELTQHQVESLRATFESSIPDWRYNYLFSNMTIIRHGFEIIFSFFKEIARYVEIEEYALFDFIGELWWNIGIELMHDPSLTSIERYEILEDLHYAGEEILDRLKNAV